jgi:LemA protein
VSAAMSSGSVGLLVILALAGGGAAVLYNRLVSARQRVREAWSAMDVQLQRRASLIPNLVEVVKGYAGYERQTMQQLVEARSALGAADGPRAAARANAAVSGALVPVFALAEAYPDLKANERYAQLQRDLADTENLIAFARNYYNGAVEMYNNRAQRFPSLMFARLFGFPPAEFFAAEPSAAEVVAANL